MDANAFLVVFMRWLHIVPAAVAIGGVFFMRVVLPAGLKELGPEQREAVFLRCRRVFKMVIHTCILFLLVSGTYNSVRLFPQYHGLHGLWGGHVLLGLVAIGISLWLLMGKRPPASHRGWAMVNLVLLLALVAVASTLKWARESRAAAATQPVVETR